MIDRIRQFFSFSPLTKRANLRTQILLPFILITTFMTLISMLGAIAFISDTIEKRLADQLEKHRLFVHKSIEERLHKSQFYTQLVADMKKNVDKIHNQKVLSGVKSILIQALAQDRTKIYWTLKDIPYQKRDLYADLISTGYSGKSKIQYMINQEGDRVLDTDIVAVTPLKNHGYYYPVISEFPINDAFLIDIKSKYKSEIAIIYHGFFKNSPYTEIVTSTQLLTENKEIKNQVIRLMNAYPIDGTPSPLTGSIDIDHKSYKVIFERLDLNPSLYVAVIITAEDIFIAKRNIIIGTVIILMLVMGLIMTIYSVIVGKITASLDILMEVIQKVTKGDLEQKVPILSHDEIGELSSMFNQMVTSLKESSANVIYEKNRSEAIIANLPEGIIVTDSQNRLILANQRAEEMFNFSMQENLGKFILECINNQELLNFIKEQLQHAKPYITREVRMHKDKGKNKIYLLTSNLAKNKNDQNIGVITILRDITRERELEELREGFLRTVSHELRTPLTAVIGFIDLIYRGTAGPINDQQKEYLDISLNSAITLKNLINDLLDLSRIEAGKVKLLYSSVKVHEFLENIAASFFPLVHTKHLELQIMSIDPDLVMMADIEKLRRIFVNLISNAIKFTETGHITVSCKDVEDSLHFSVKDTGIGLLDEEKEIIFDKFQQVDYSSTRKYEGIGLGLSIVRELVELHRGKIWVESQHKVGSTFSFSIPKEQPESEE